MNILHYVDSLSYKQILSIAVLLAILFAVPTTVWLVRQQTRLYSSAHKTNLPTEYVIIEEPFGSPSSNPPKIQAVKPFLGKVDDVVVISGQDFGQNPQQRAIFFGEVKAAEEDILKWHNDSIEVMVPEGAVSGPIKVLEVDTQDIYGLPFTVYGPMAKTKVYWQGNNLMVSEGYSVKKVSVVFGSGQAIEAQVDINQSQAVLIDKLSSTDIYNLALYNQFGELVPFYVNPTEFGF